MAIVLIVTRTVVEDWQTRRALVSYPRAKQPVAQAETQLLADMVEQWMIDTAHASLPESFALGDLTHGAAPYVRRQELNDPWNVPYRLARTGADFRIVSNGADGSIGGTGQGADIRSTPRAIRR